jgi:hypothetical protein
VICGTVPSRSAAAVSAADTSRSDPSDSRPSRREWRGALRRFKKHSHFVPGLCYMEQTLMLLTVLKFALLEPFSFCARLNGAQYSEGE